MGYFMKTVKIVYWPNYQDPIPQYVEVEDTCTEQEAKQKAIEIWFNTFLHKDNNPLICVTIEGV